MSKELELYKAFIDGLVERKDSMTALWVKGDGFPKTEDNKAKNDFLANTDTGAERCWPRCFRTNILRVSTIPLHISMR